MSPASQGALGSAAPLRTEAQAWLRYPRRRAGRVCDAAARSPAAARAPRRAGRHLSGENLRCARRRQRPAFRVLQSGVSSGKTRLPAAKRAGDLRNTRQNSASALPLSVEPCLARGALLMGKSSSAESARQRGEAPSVELRAQPLSLPPSRLNVEVRSLLARGGRGARSATTASATARPPRGCRVRSAGPPGSRCARGSRPGTWLTRSHPAQRSTQRSTQLAEAQLQRRGTRKSGEANLA